MPPTLLNVASLGEKHPSIRRTPLLLAMIFAAVGIAVALLLAAGEARASSTVTLKPGPTGTCPVVVSGTCRYTSVRDAATSTVNGANGLTWTANFTGLPPAGLQVSGVTSVVADDALQSLTLTGTLSGGAPVQLTAVWGTASTPQLGIAIRPTGSSLHALNPLWSSPADPSLSTAVVVSTAQAGGSVDLSKLPASSRTFYPAGFASAQPGTGMALFAGVDVGQTSNPALQNVLRYLGVGSPANGSTATVQGTLANSLAPILSSSSTAADQAGLNLSISSTTSGGSSPAWLTSRTVKAQLSIPAGGGAPAISFSDTLVTSLGGQANTFAGTFGYDPAAGAKGTVSVSYAIQSGSTFHAPFGLGTLQLSDSALSLSATVGSSPQFSGDLTSTVTLNAHTFGIAAHLDGGSGALAGNLSVTGSISAADSVALGDALVGSTVTPDAGSVGSSLTLNSAQFSFATASGAAKTFALTASTSFRGATADVLASIQLPTSGPAKLFFGVHAANLSPGTLIAQPSPMLAGLTFPSADLFISKGYLVGGKATQVPWSDLLPAQQAFFTSVNGGTAPATISFGPTLSFAGTLTLPDAVAARFGISDPVQFSGDLGFGLDTLGTGTAPALGGSLHATLPAMTAGLPSWVSSTGPWTVDIAADSNHNVQLALDGSVVATVDSRTFTADVTGAVGKVDGTVSFDLTGKLTGTFDNLFGLTWLSATNPSVSLHVERGTAGNAMAATLSSDLAINGYAMTAEATISNSTGTSASLTVLSKDSTATVGVGGVVSFFGGDPATLTGMPAASLNSLQARVTATRNGGTAVTVDVVADTSVAFRSGGDTFDSQVLLSITKPPVGATSVIAGFRANTPVHLSDFISGPAVDFSFPSLAIVVANQAKTLTYAGLLPAEQD
ncbi:MAG: hypothetical protein QOC80_1110, partial [Frankiaceae bacterium]|nr:hypothetical protein [Frankiaceae bacterium]